LDQSKDSGKEKEDESKEEKGGMFPFSWLISSTPMSKNVSPFPVDAYLHHLKFNTSI
jgi:hypothetical protein